MSDEIIIANPIYDVVFKRLMEDTENARFFIETLLDQEVENIQFKPQEYILSKDKDKEIISSLQKLPLAGAMTFFRLDFIATIKTVNGEHQKVLIEVQKGKKNLDMMRFRGYLAEHYKRTDDLETPDAGVQQSPFHIITIYILGFELEHITTSAVKIAREYIDLITKEPISEKEDFIEQLTHDCIIIQTPRIQDTIKTELDALLSLFEQDYFIDQYGHLKKYTKTLDNEHIRRMANTLSYVAASEEGRREMDIEESVRRMIEGDFDETVQKIRYELKQKNKALTESKQIIAEKENALTEKEQTITDQAKQIAELLVQLNSIKR